MSILVKLMMDLPGRHKTIIIFQLMVIGALLITSCSKNLYRERPSGESGNPAIEKDSGPGRTGRARENDRAVPADRLSDADAELPESEDPDSDSETPVEIIINKDFLKAGSELSLNVGNTGAGQIIETALEYIGVPHCMGGTTRKCIDCSGLLLTAFASHGIKLPHSAEEQARYGRIVYSASQLRRGDLVFFTRSYRTSRYITHSGIYLGNNEFIHASTTSGVTITSLSNRWWREKFVFGTRLFEPQ